MAKSHTLPNEAAEAPVAAAMPHYLGHRDRLRARLLEGGTDALPDYELLEFLLYSAQARRDMKPLAKALLARFGGIAGVLGADREALKAVAGMGDASVATLLAVRAAAARLLRAEVTARPVISSWQALVDYCAAQAGFAETEEFRLLFLDRKNALIRDERQQRGTVDHTPVYPREVVKRALELGASALIMVHNHPSGDTTPSKADIDMTRAVAKALTAVGIALHDHLVVGRGKHASFRSLGLL
ncbi:MAG TPA: DNA repair protein RadC [Stellaceae bacterium]|jgi:DNA repair protein RadC|nr:DNA repair protein RadC [Stellaceae bacterium]